MQVYIKGVRYNNLPFKTKKELVNIFRVSIETEEHCKKKE